MPNYNFVDLTDQPFGLLTVLRRDPDPPRKSGQASWICQCACGNVVSIAAYQLRKRGTKSCGCLRSEQPPPNFLDLTGQPFTRLTVLRRDIRPDLPTWPVRWICECVCGNIVSVTTRDLRSNHTRSCGCLLEEHWQTSQLKHGAARKSKRTPEYRIWCHMKERCTNPASPDYPRWGGRGITICDRWLHSFPAFLEDMGERPTPKHTLERLDNDGPYTKDNCVWDTRIKQARNTRNNVLLTLNGETHCISEWSEIVPISQRTIAERYRAGWDDERILTTPPRRWPSQQA